MAENKDFEDPTKTPYILGSISGFSTKITAEEREALNITVKNMNPSQQEEFMRGVEEGQKKRSVKEQKK